MRQIWKRKHPERIFKANLQAVYQLSTAEDMKAGGRWYPNGKRSVEVLADRFNLEPRRCAGVVAALSPSCAWGKNLEYAKHFISGFVAGVDVLAQSFKAGTYGLKNKTTALGFLTTKPIDEEFPKLGPKTGQFYCNLLGDLSSATVDGHMYAMMVADDEAPTHEIYAKHGRLTQGRYNVLAKALTSVAYDNGMAPATFQAIVWITWRRLKDENSNLKQGYRSNEVPF